MFSKISIDKVDRICQMTCLALPYSSFLACLLISLKCFDFFEVSGQIQAVLLMGEVCWGLHELGFTFSDNIKAIISQKITRIVGQGTKYELLPSSVGGKRESIENNAVRQGLFARRPASNRLTHLDTLRGIAALIVAVGHGTNESHVLTDSYKREFDESALNLRWFIRNHGQAMVSFFVLMSGYIFGKVYWTEKRSKNLGKLLIGRMTRLFPVHWLCQTFWVVFHSYYVYHFDRAASFGGKFIVPCILLTHFWPLTDEPPIICNYPAWSLSVEWGLNILFFICIRIFPTYWNLFMFSMAALYGYNRFSDDVVGFTLPGMLTFGFFVGVIYQKLVGRFHVERLILQIPFDFMALYLVLNPFTYLLRNFHGDFDGSYHSVDFSIVFYGMYVMVALDNSFFMKKLFGLFHFFGDVSFSLYLCHYPMLMLFQDLVMTGYLSSVNNDLEYAVLIGIIVFVSALIHYQFEKPVKSHLDMAFGIVDKKSNKLIIETADIESDKFD